ncbi:thermonuclease family protein [Antarcticibacterium arcticum]|nr:thermonuclease family protein [Antarcticibacterium arcticum]
MPIKSSVKLKNFGFLTATNLIRVLAVFAGMTATKIMRQTLTYILFLTTFVCLGTTTKVTRVIDGDTFETETGEKVRLIGINAPEISDIFGKEAKEYLSSLIENKTVFLQYDNLSKDRDRYQRLLRYVILDGVDINKKMIADGFAFAYLKYQFSNSSDYKTAQFQARETNSGIWGDGNKETIIDEQEINEASFWQDLSLKAYLVGSLVGILLFIGLYTYFRK